MEVTPSVVVVVAVVAIALTFVLIRRGRRNEAALPGAAPRNPPRTISMAARTGSDSDSLVAFLLDHAQKETGVRLADDALARDRIEKAAHKALEDLRASGSAAINLPFLAADESGPKHFAVRLKRNSESTFEVLP